MIPVYLLRDDYGPANRPLIRQEISRVFRMAGFKETYQRGSGWVRNLLQGFVCVASTLVRPQEVSGVL